ncbi:helix-turn-helix domain-containing protein [Inquilinus sp. CA228]|uniref:helix-turn-helix domain-containing protein n=1 Tax=Inquilinus sp. CA228 TaxID=3455609 RepID=UPI003F8D307B
MRSDLANELEPVDARLAARLAALRAEQGWSLDALAERSGVSRATLSRLERGETSPTASLLGRLCTAYGRTMSGLIAEVETDPPQLLRREDQPGWTDPETGFRRRSVSPPATGFRGELVEGVLPADAVVSYDTPPIHGLEQHVWMLDGMLDLMVDDVVHRLRPGDCLRYRLFGPTRFHCPGPQPAHYVIALCKP